jgi:hypothetical protein
MKWRIVKKELSNRFLEEKKFDTERYSKVKSFIAFVKSNKSCMTKDFNKLFGDYYKLYEKQKENS